MTPQIHQWITIGFLVAVALTMIAYDVAVAWLVGHHATISTALLRFSLDHQIIVPIVCFAAGLLVGHIFLPQYLR